MRTAHLVLLLQFVSFAAFAVPMLTGCGNWEANDDDGDYGRDYGSSGSYTPPTPPSSPAPSCDAALYVSITAPYTGDCRLSIAPSDSAYSYDQKAIISYFFPAPTDAGASTCTPIGSAPPLQQCHREELGISISTSGTYDLAAIRKVLGPSIDTTGVTVTLDCAATADPVTENDLLVCAAAPAPSQNDDAGTSTDSDAAASSSDAAALPDTNADGGAPQADAGCGP